MTLNTPPRPIEPDTFHALVDVAARQRRGAGARLALDAGLDLQGLCRFAAGALSAPERGQVEAQVATTTWATGRIAALLRGARGTEHGGLARGILEAARAGHIDAAREVGRALLRDAGLLDAQGERSASPSAQGEDPRVRGGLALAGGRPSEASQAFSQLEDPSPLSRLAARVAQLERDPDLALCELLDLL